MQRNLLAFITRAALTLLLAIPFRGLPTTQPKQSIAKPCATSVRYGAARAWKAPSLVQPQRDLLAGLACGERVIG